MPGGEPKLFYRGLGRPQGLAFDRAGNLYVVASLGGRRGIVRITPDAQAELVLSGNDLVGLALLPTHRAYLTTTGALFSMDWDVEGMASAGLSFSRATARLLAFSRFSRIIIQRMKAEIIAVGSELLTPDRIDTNSLFLTAELNKLGIEVIRKTVVGDKRADVGEAFGTALARAELVDLQRRPRSHRRRPDA